VALNGCAALTAQLRSQQPPDATLSQQLQHCTDRLSSALKDATVGPPPQTLALQLGHCQPPLLVTLSAFAHAALFGHSTGGVSQQAVRALLTQSLPALAARLATEAPQLATGCLRVLQSVADAAAEVRTFSAPLVAACWGASLGLLTGAEGHSLGPYAGEAARALAQLAQACALRLRDCRADDAFARDRDETLASFAAQSCLKLAVRAPGAGVAAWEAVLEAAAAARLTLWRPGGQACAALAREALPRLDGCVYKTLEGAPGVEVQVQLLRTLCSDDGCLQAGCLSAACPLCALLRRGAASLPAGWLPVRCALFCDAVLSRARQQPPGLRLAAMAHLGWALDAAARNGTAFALAQPQPHAALLAALRRGAGAALGCAAAEGGGAWDSAQRLLLGSCLAAHPLERWLALDLWGALAAASPPEMARQQAGALTTLLHAACEGSGDDATRAKDGVARLAAAACRLMEACPDCSAAEGAYQRLFVGTQTQTLSRAAVALLANGFPLHRLQGAHGEHARRALPLAAAEALTQSAAPGDARLRCAADCLAALSPWLTDPDAKHAAASAALQVVQRFDAHGGGGESAETAAVCMQLAASHAAALDAAQAAALTDLLLAACERDSLSPARHALPLLLSARPQQPPSCAPLLAAAFRQPAWPHIHAAGVHYLAMRGKTGGGARAFNALIPEDAAGGGREAAKQRARAPLVPAFVADALAALSGDAEAEMMEEDAAVLAQHSRPGD